MEQDGDDIPCLPVFSYKALELTRQLELGTEWCSSCAPGGGLPLQKSGPPAEPRVLVSRATPTPTFWFPDPVITHTRDTTLVWSLTCSAHHPGGSWCVTAGRPPQAGTELPRLQATPPLPQAGTYGCVAVREHVGPTVPQSHAH